MLQLGAVLGLPLSPCMRPTQLGRAPQPRALPWKPGVGQEQLRSLTRMYARGASAELWTGRLACLCLHALGGENFIFNSNACLLIKILAS